MTINRSHEKNFGMRLLLFVLGLVVSSTALSAQQIAGKVERIGHRAFLKTNAQEACHKFQIMANSKEVSEVIHKLSTGDSLTASGVKANDTCTVYIDSVDYVGLKDLLGYWYAKEGYVKVHDFTSVSVYSLELVNLKNSKEFSNVDSIEFRYSITPSNGKEWVLFLSTAESTTFATIDLQNHLATIKIYDSENGSIMRTIRLSKWGNL